MTTLSYSIEDRFIAKVSLWDMWTQKKLGLLLDVALMITILLYLIVAPGKIRFEDRAAPLFYRRRDFP
jgi:hypothetical protein